MLVADFAIVVALAIVETRLAHAALPCAWERASSRRGEMAIVHRNRPFCSPAGAYHLWLPVFVMNQCTFPALVRQVQLQPATFMTNQKPHGVHINRVHSGAICAEIGERLHDAIPAAPTRLPPHLLDLTTRLDRIQPSGVLEESPCD